MQRFPTMSDYRAADRLVSLALRDGGFTVDRDTLLPVTLNGGFMVSSASGEERVSSDDSSVVVEAAVSRLKRLLAGTPASWFIGGWIDADGLLCLDASERVIGLEKALTTGRARNQDAIFRNPCDGRPGETIPLH